MNWNIYHFPIIDLCLVENHMGLEEIFPWDGTREMPDTPKASLLLDEAANQLQRYFQGTLTHFDLALAPKGTSFQQEVWQEILKIPYGETTTYKEIAAAVNRPKGSQAVGQGVGRNPLMIVIPCHRVIGSKGQLTGYRWGLSLKEQLLALEQSTPKE